MSLGEGLWPLLGVWKPGAAEGAATGDAARGPGALDGPEKLLPLLCSRVGERRARWGGSAEWRA
eukprot:12287446-Heterocapsa_arctica.AAC.1